MNYNYIKDIIRKISCSIFYYLDIIYSRFLLLLLLNTAFFTVISYYLPIQFEENDDVLMLLMSNGTFAGADGFLVFISSFYGKFVSFLYLTFPYIEWYTILFSIFHLLSISIIIHSIYKMNINRIISIWGIVLFYCFEIVIVSKFQFTTTAAITALAGVVLIISNYKPNRILGIFLFVVSSLIRYEAAFLVLLVFIPFFVINLLYVKKEVKSILVYVIIAIIVAFGFKEWNSYILSNNKKIQSYIEYNKIRGKIHDNPNTSLIIKKFPDVIPKEDFKIFSDFLIDAHVFNGQKIKEINSLFPNITLKENINHIVQFFNRYLFQLSILSILFCLVFFATTNKKAKLIIFISFLFTIVILGIVSMNATVKDRVFLTALFPLVFVLISNAHKLKINHTRNFTLILIILSMQLISILLCFRFSALFVYVSFFIILLFSFKHFFYFKLGFFISLCIVFIYLFRDRILYQKNEKETSRIEFLNKIELILAYNKQVIPFKIDLPIEQQNPFKITKQMKNLPIVYSGWLTNYPFQTIQTFSFDLLTKQAALFVHKNHMIYIGPLIEQSIQTNYGLSVKYIIKAEDKQNAIIKFQVQLK